MSSGNNRTYAILKQYLHVLRIGVCRFFQGIGPFRFALLLLLAVAVFMNLFFMPSYVPLVIYALIIYIYNARKRDREFLRIVVGERYKLCYCILYSIISFPFFLISLLKTDWIVAASYPLLAVFITFLPSFNKFVGLRFSHSFLTKDAYEYQSGFRFSSMLYVALFLFSVMGACHGNSQIPKVLVVCAVFLLNVFYMLEYRCEYVLNYSKASAIFLFKVKNITINNAVYLLPFFALILVFEHSTRSLYVCLMLYIISVVTMISSLSFRIIFEKPDLIACLLITLFYVVAVSSIRYLGVLPICVVVSFSLLVAAYCKVKKITRI